MGGATAELVNKLPLPCRAAVGQQHVLLILLNIQLFILKVQKICCLFPLHRYKNEGWISVINEERPQGHVPLWYTSDKNIFSVSEGRRNHIHEKVEAFPVGYIQNHIYVYERTTKPFGPSSHIQIMGFFLLENVNYFS